MMNQDAIRQLLLTVLDEQDILPPDAAAPHLSDQRRRYHSQALVVQPRTVAAVQQTVRLCREHAICITPQGGNTGLVGGSHAERGIILNLSRLNQIRAVNHADNSITVEAGCILQHVQEAAAAAGRFFPLSLASEGSCQIGGNIACNAGGLNVVRYGTMRDLVLGLEVVLPDGELVSQLAPLHKNTTGYELKHLFIGSEGTLGIITAATLKLFAQAQSTATAWIGLPDIEAATALLVSVQTAFAERLTSFELISGYALQLSSAYSRLPQPTAAQWHILLELNDSLPQQNLDDTLAEHLYQHGYDNSIIAQSEQQRHDFWQLRENISASQRSLGVSIKHDIATPIANIAGFIRECQAELLQHYPDMNIVVFGHLGDGSLHYNTFLPDTLDNRAYEQETQINDIVYRHIHRQNGTIAAEHGIGQLKNQRLHQVRSPAEIALMRAIKHQLDPQQLFNPGKLLPDEN